MALLSIGIASNASTLEKAFGLQDKAYADVTKDKLNRYKINDNLLLSLQVSKVDKYDGYQGKYLKAQFKKPSLTNWTFIETIWIYSYSNNLIFTDINGLTLTIRTKSSNIYTEDKHTTDNEANGKLVELKVVYVKGVYSVYVNSQKLYKGKKRFGALKSITQHLFKADIVIDINLMEIK